MGILVILSELGRKALFGCFFIVLVKSRPTPQQMKRKRSVLLKKKKNEKGVQHEDFLRGHPS